MLSRIIAFWLISICSFPVSANDQLLKGLLTAVNNCDLNTTALLLDRGANPNTFKKRGISIPSYDNALTKAIARARTKRSDECRDLVLMLLEQGKADPNLQSPIGSNAMHLLAQSRINLEMFEMLRSHGGSPNLQLNKNAGRSQGKSFLMAVIQGGSGARVDQLSGTSSKKGAEKLKVELDKIVYIAKLTNLDLQDASGKTALIYAAKNRNCKVVSELVKLGADTQIKDAEGQTALDYALGNASAECIAILDK